MTTARTMRVARAVAMLGALGRAPSLHAQIEIGTWVRQVGADTPGVITMTVEACCNGGRRLVYHVVIDKTETLLTVESRVDGSEAPVLMNRKPSGETMAIKRVDDHHTSAVLKMNGTLFATAKATLSADGRTLTVINDYSSSVGGQPVGKYTEVWVRK